MKSKAYTAGSLNSPARPPPRIRSLRDRIRLTLHSRGSPEAIARGVALGLFVAVSPLFGLHIPITLLAATFLRANRPAALLAVFTSNVATFAPIFTFTYAVGARLLPGRPPLEVRSLLNTIAERMRGRPFFHVVEAALDLFHSLKGLFWPLLLGGLIVGTLAAVVAYPLTLRLILQMRNRRKKWLATHPNTLRRLERMRSVSMPSAPDDVRTGPPGA
jgi:hypothetical protein